MKKQFKLSIIIPMHNEKNTILSLLEKIQLTQIPKEVIIVNDGSTDDSVNLLEKKPYLYDKLISYKINKGKGYACKIGIKNASGSFLIIQDADLEYDPNDYEKMISIISDEVKVIYGSRALKGGKVISPAGVRPYFSKFANYMLTKISNLLNGQNLTDAHTCYKLFETDIINKIDLKENGFAFCPEVTAKISKLGLKISEVPIDYNGRDYKDGKKIKTIHAFEAILALLIYNFPYKRYKNWLRG